MTTLKITPHDPTTLVPNPRNSRLHTDDQIDKLVESIKAVGFNKPVVIGRDKVIYAGHGATLAAIKLGLKSIPTVSIDHLSETQKRGFMIADILALVHSRRGGGVKAPQSDDFWRTMNFSA